MYVSPSFPRDRVKCRKAVLQNFRTPPKGSETHTTLYSDILFSYYTIIQHIIPYYTIAVQDGVRGAPARLGRRDHSPHRAAL